MALVKWALATSRHLLWSLLLYGMWQSTWCHHVWYVTVYMVSPPYMICDSLYGMWQSTWCHHIWYVTVYMVSLYMVCASLHGVTIYGMWQTTWCHHIWYVPVYMVSPYIVCASLHGVTIYGMWQTTWCHHVPFYMVSPYMVCDRLHGAHTHNSSHHCWLLLNFHNLLEILSLCPFYIHFSFCIFTCRRYLYVFKLNSTSKTHLYIISV